MGAVSICVSLLMGSLLCGHAMCKERSQRPQPTKLKNEWEFVGNAELLISPSELWKQIQYPGTFLKLTWGQMLYTLQKRGTANLILEMPNGEEIALDVEETSQDDRFHIFTIVSHTRGLFQSRLSLDPILLDGSQMFVWIANPSGETSTVEVGWAAKNIGFRVKPLVDQVMKGILLGMLDQMRGAFGSSECTSDNSRRTINGVCNNPKQPTWGMAGTSLQPAKGTNFPSLGKDFNPREISNAIMEEEIDKDGDSSNKNKLQLTDLFVIFGQFIDHDLSITPTGKSETARGASFSCGREKFTESFHIRVPKDDAKINAPSIEFHRGLWVREDNEDVVPRRHVNQLSAFLDLGQVYGNDQLRARSLRSFFGGLLKTSEQNFLPYNGSGKRGAIGIALENDPDTRNIFFAAGDIRANEHLVLTAIHTLWMREHNTVARELAQKFPDWSDEELYQQARGIVIAEYQSIVYGEWLDRLLGKGDLSAKGYKYDSSIDPSISSFFSSVAFRFGHSMVSNKFWQIRGGQVANHPPKPDKTISLTDAFFQPDKFFQIGVDDLLRGASWHVAPDLDEKIVPALRNELFGHDPGMDLAAINIQRSRDMGVPRYNEACKLYGIPSANSFKDITQEEELSEVLAKVYSGRVDAIDAFVGGLSEKPLKGKLLGPLFYAAIFDQFQRLRDGDRHFYRKFPFSEELRIKYDRIVDILRGEVKLADIIMRNTNIQANELGIPDRTSLFDTKTK